MTSETARTQSAAPSLAIARAFVAARRDARALPGFPGEIPRTLEAGYAAQEAAIRLWGGEIVGWKVGKIPDELVARLGKTRVTGPIFREGLWPAEPSGRNPVPVLVGGFAALEAEFVFELTRDAPADKLDWTLAEAEALQGRMRTGVEMAGSPLAAINELGPPVVASDFGNNNGLILGEVLADWGEAAAESYVCESFIDGERVGQGSAASIPGGPMESVRFLLEHCARRGRPLRAGQLVSTGAATGIHDIAAGQIGRVSFGRHGAIGCVTFAATPQAQAAS
ncbi:MAG TPA: 2-keto-4-pentenoate hydratase [Caulobacteraceae bacterium]